MNEQQFKERTKKLALAITQMAEELPQGWTTRIYATQLVRAATSVAANYRAACRARSTAEMISKLGTVEEEADESAFWLERLVDGRKASKETAAPLIRESNEILAMTVASIKTLRNRPPTNRR